MVGGLSFACSMRHFRLDCTIRVSAEKPKNNSTATVLVHKNPSNPIDELTNIMYMYGQTPKS